MKKLLVITSLTLIIGLLLMSGGYAQWEQKLIIKGQIQIKNADNPTAPTTTIGGGGG